MTAQNSNQQYFNDAQQFIVAMNARTTVSVCGRGFGKGAVQAARLQTAFQGMPGSTGGFVSPSVKRCLTNILPSMLIHLERWGFKRDVHWTVGKKPWKALHWKTPVFTPDNWENTISFYNGSVCDIISQDRKGTSNSMSLDYAIVDEAKFIDAEQYHNETDLANRGNESLFGHFFMHHGETITSDMPITKKGSWFLKYQDKMDVDLVESLYFVCRKIGALKRMAMEDPAARYQIGKEIDRWRAVRDKMRRDAVLYCEFSTLENIDILSEDYIRRMKRNLPDQTFQTAILNKRQRIARDGFYGSLDEDVNLYTAPNISYLDNMEYNFQKLKQEDCRMDSDLVRGQPLVVAFDANGKFNCLCVGQDLGSEARYLKSFYTKYDRHLPELVGDFCKYYQYHDIHQVIFYFDATFVGSTTGIHDNEIYVIIENAFLDNGWDVEKVYIGKPMEHIEKHLLINRGFKGQANHRIRINRDNNEDMLIALSNAQIVNGKKDKSGEKAVETEEDQLQHRTDFTDAFDTVFIGMELFPYTSDVSLPPIYYPTSS